MRRLDTLKLLYKCKCNIQSQSSHSEVPFKTVEDGAYLNNVFRPVRQLGELVGVTLLYVRSEQTDLLYGNAKDLIPLSFILLLLSL